MIEINTGSNRATAVVKSVPDNLVSSGGLDAFVKHLYPLAEKVIDAYTHLGTLRQTVLNSRGRVKRVRIILGEHEFLRKRIAMANSAWASA